MGRYKLRLMLLLVTLMLRLSKFLIGRVQRRYILQYVETPLYMAVKDGCSDAAKLLLSHGIHVEAEANFLTKITEFVVGFHLLGFSYMEFDVCDPGVFLARYVNEFLPRHVDVVAVVLFVGDIRTVKRGNAEDKVRDILLAGESVSRPIKLTAWNEYAEKDAAFYKAWANGFMVVGFTGIRPVTYQGLSLLTTMSTAYDHEPVGEMADAVRTWASKNAMSLEDWRGKAIMLGSTDRVISTVAEISDKKATSIWQDEKFWIQATLPHIVEKDVHCYVRCSLCGRTSTDAIGTRYVV